jgi:hypothetical protein
MTVSPKSGLWDQKNGASWGQVLWDITPRALHTVASGILSGFLRSWIVCLSICALTCCRKQSRVKADRIPDTPAGACR